MTDDLVIPPRFFASMTPKEFRVLCERDGVLDAEQCARLWRMTDRQDTPPENGIQLIFSRKDIEAWLDTRRKRS